jgi:hypothetical protein
LIEGEIQTNQLIESSEGGVDVHGWHSGFPLIKMKVGFPNIVTMQTLLKARELCQHRVINPTDYWVIC